jgi:hypothetical protein
MKCVLMKWKRQLVRQHRYKRPPKFLSLYRYIVSIVDLAARDKRPCQTFEVCDLISVCSVAKKVSLPQSVVKVNVVFVKKP